MNVVLEIQDADINVLAGLAIRMEDEGQIGAAISLYKIAISLGDLTCTTRLADLLSDEADFRDIPLAEELYLKACVAGHAPGCRNLAIMYKQLGKSVLHDRYMSLAKARGDVWQVEDE